MRNPLGAVSLRTFTSKAAFGMMLTCPAGGCNNRAICHPQDYVR